MKFKSKYCSACGYKFKKDEGAICPECFTSRDDSLQCADLHTHVEDNYSDQNRIDRESRYATEAEHDAEYAQPSEDQNRIDRDSRYATEAEHNADYAQPQSSTQSAWAENSSYNWQSNSDYARQQAVIQGKIKARRLLIVVIVIICFNIISAIIIGNLDDILADVSTVDYSNESVDSESSYDYDSDSSYDYDALGDDFLDFDERELNEPFRIGEIIFEISSARLDEDNQQLELNFKATNVSDKDIYFYSSDDIAYVETYHDILEDFFELPIINGNDEIRHDVDAGDTITFSMYFDVSERYDDFFFINVIDEIYDENDEYVGYYYVSTYYDLL